MSSCCSACISPSFKESRCLLFQIKSPVFNPSVWSDEHCSSWCTLSLICLYLDNIGSKCNRAASCLFVKELSLLWCGRQLLEIISSFFLCSRTLGFLFAVPNSTDDFMRPSNSEMKQETNVIAIVT